MTHEGAAPPVLAVILAGGENRRYGGDPKALARVGGERIADRAIGAMREVVPRVVIVANDPETFGVLGLPMRPDVRPGLGALGGIYTAVRWAEDEGCRGALVAACDMPFLSADLLRRLVDGASSDQAVLPQSDSPRGMEPLCAFYGVGCRAAIEGALDRGDRAIVSFFGDVDLRLVPGPEVARLGDPHRMFLNVNTPAERERAEELLVRPQASEA